MKYLAFFIILSNMTLAQNTSTSSTKSIVLGGGCFWCIEAAFEAAKGVSSVVSGYSGGDIKNPSYREVTSGRTKHAEVCKINYDPTIITLENILEIFFLVHDPTTLNRQGYDIGSHYRSIILFNSSEEEKLISSIIDRYNNDYFDNSIVTEVKAFQAFYVAEDYHQEYYKLNANQPYCKAVIAPKLQKAREKLSKYY
jgi:methionine-S-sulfoxide reductase